MKTAEKSRLNISMINNYLIALIFLIVPVIFSHFLYIFWINYSLPTAYSYESIKVLAFLCIVLGIWTFGLLRSWIFSFKFKISRRTIYLLLMFIIFLISSSLSVNQEISLFWSPQKSHWAIFYLALIYLYLVLIDILPKKIYLSEFFNKVILSTWIVVSLYALIQLLWLDPLFSLYTTRVPLERVFSTFWNANYLAWYMLILLPLVFNLKASNRLKFSLFLIFWIVLIATRSMFWIILLMCYSLYLIFNSRKLKGKHFLLTAVFLSFLAISSYFYLKYNIWNMKLYSAFSRFYLIKTALNAYFNSFQSILFWNGFDTLYLVYKDFKDPMLNIYEDYNYIADSSHNVFIDILYSVWLIWFIWIFLPLFMLLRRADNIYLLHSTILFFIFFSFNIPSVSHYLILIYCLSSIRLKK
ncbi:MAG: hypothetical protein ACD_3C00214G0001 [uncultured bacterium (gcode 4)]|uniref:Uncharacterized protein n=1 Tax=uncultured bacterium (gcode 4) TaxID=1234023 RepID=K2GVM7_9BACT|nr:MAG: hypothetical protein ACD_3C00214G0001 [uncultured bacterium (gcode 4)]